MAVIYRLVCTVNDKGYIGFAEESIEARWKTHCARARSLNPSQAIDKAIRKYGEENFIREVITECEEAEYTKNVLENKYILEYGTFAPDGYNLTLGGDGHLGFKHKQSTKDKISEANKGNQNWLGKIHTEESKQKMRESRIGLTASAETRKLMSVNRTGSGNGNSIIWEVTCPNGIILVVKDRKAFCEENGLNYKSLLQMIHQGRPSYKGYIFKRLGYNK